MQIRGKTGVLKKKPKYEKRKAVKVFELAAPCCPSVSSPWINVLHIGTPDLRIHDRRRATTATAAAHTHFPEKPYV